VEVSGPPSRSSTPGYGNSAAVRAGRWVALASIAGSAALAVTKIVTGLMAGSTSVVADGVESAGDVGTSTFVLFGMLLGAKPADENHPYGHGRFEILVGLVVGMVLVAVGAGICVSSLRNVAEVHPPPAVYGIWPLIGSALVKAGFSTLKFRYGRKIRSAALVADAWNDTVDILSAISALAALGLTLYDPQRFLAADHYGGAAVGVIVVLTGLRVGREAALELMDTMPDESLMAEIREAAAKVPGVLGVEKCYARKTGMQYHVDIHLEVDPELTVRESHDIATNARIQIREKLGWVADILVHVEPLLPATKGEEYDSGRMAD